MGTLGFDSCIRQPKEPILCFLAEQIQLTCNVSIKNPCVAENYAFLGSLGS